MAQNLHWAHSHRAPLADDEGLTLDLDSRSEFPSLSSAPAQHHQNPSQAAWASSTQRLTTQTPVQRPQLQGNGGQTASTQPQQHQQQPSDLYPSSSHFANRLEDFPYTGGQNAVGQLPGPNQPKTGSIDEFPPLGGTANGEIGQERQGGMMHNAGFGGHSGAQAFGRSQGQNQNFQNRMLGSMTGQQEGHRQGGHAAGILSPVGLGSGAMSSSRSPAESVRQGQGGLADADANNMINPTQNNSSIPNLFSNAQNGPRSGQTTQQSSQHGAFAPQPQRSLQHSQSGFGGELAESPQNSQPPDTLSSMSEIDRFGLAGLLHMIRNEGSDVGSLAIGQELTALGLDLNQPEALYTTFASPFAAPGSRSVEPDFAVPTCYTVQNIHPLPSKVSSFSDETLFYIFYSMPRDVMQEIVAVELSNRNWRYHKELKQWLTKDAQYEPVQVNDMEERGYYVFFDPHLWQRQRREFLLRYDHLDSRNIQPTPLGPGQ
ncbi:MAG: hypothetical protein M1833_004596 [Piccolia ochrophora]|nr:MAG: hypothetical protein M1833_004596 [Piccolia ochrophora]